MTTDYKVTELFCIIDEFCKHFEAENAGNLLIVIKSGDVFIRILRQAGIIGEYDYDANIDFTDAVVFK